MSGDYDLGVSPSAENTAPAPDDQSALNAPSRRVICCSEDATNALGTALAACLRLGDVIALNGPMGAGKSHLARAMIRAAAGDPDMLVPSPTFTLANVFETQLGEIWHADLYRIADPEELEEIGLLDHTMDRVVLVEWPERWPDMPADHLEIHISPVGPDERQFEFVAASNGWRARLAALDFPE